MSLIVVIGRVLAYKVGLAPVNLHVREVAMVLGEVHLVTENESVAVGAPFGQGFASMRDGNLFGGRDCSKVLRHSLEAFLDEGLGLGTFSIGQAIRGLAIGVAILVRDMLGLGFLLSISTRTRASASGGGGSGVPRERSYLVSEGFDLCLESLDSGVFLEGLFPRWVVALLECDDFGDPLE